MKEKCLKCSTKIIPDKEAVNNTNKWDGHSFKFNCNCVPDTTRISVG